jgi:hypothetical protein
MSDGKPPLKELLEHYTPEQLAHPDPKFGTVEKRIKALYNEEPKKAEKEFLEEVEKQRQDVEKQAAAGAGD